MAFNLYSFYDEIFSVPIYPSFVLHRCKGMPLSPLGSGGAGATGLWGALSLEPAELRCLQLDLSEED